MRSRDAYSGKPDSPYGLRFINATHDSVTLSWQPGFNGGLPQRFQVRYGEVSGEGMKYEDVVPTTANTYTVKGLSMLAVVVANWRALNTVHTITSAIPLVVTGEQQVH